MADFFEVVITAFIFRDDRVLLTRRAASKNRFPSLWTVPGGHLERSDFEKLPKEGEYWYDVLEIALRREVQEEVGLQIADIRHVENLATIHHDSAVIVLSCSAAWVAGEVVLDPNEADMFAWVSREEAKTCNLISGLPQEIERAFERRRR
jgi:8-oxo-dGTP diphosphatase